MDEGVSVDTLAGKGARVEIAAGVLVAIVPAGFVFVVVEDDFDCVTAFEVVDE